MLESTTKLEDNITRLSMLLDVQLQNMLIEENNMLPTIPVTFRCIEESSKAFKNKLFGNISLEYQIKRTIGNVLIEDKFKSVYNPPYDEFFNKIINRLVEKEKTI